MKKLIGGGLAAATPTGALSGAGTASADSGSFLNAMDNSGYVQRGGQQPLLPQLQLHRLGQRPAVRVHRQRLPLLMLEAIRALLNRSSRDPQDYVAPPRPVPYHGQFYYPPNERK